MGSGNTKPTAERKTLNQRYLALKEEVENGKIGVCIMKDMTRWGRDYLQAGTANPQKTGYGAITDRAAG